MRLLALMVAENKQMPHLDTDEEIACLSCMLMAFRARTWNKIQDLKC